MKMSQRYDEEQQQLKMDIEELQRQCDRENDRAFCKGQFLKAVRKFMEMKTLTPTILHELVERIDVYQTQGRGKNRTQRIVIHYNFIGVLDAYTGPRAPSARSISPTLPERSPTIPRAVLEERPCQPRRRAEPGISHRSRGWGCRWQSKQSPVIECDSGKSVIPPAWHRRFPRIPVPLHAGSSNPIQGHRGNRRD